MSGMFHKYDGYSNVHNFLFHPFHRQAEQKAKAVLAVITNVFLTAVTGGLWQIPFWIVNRLDSKKVEVLNEEKVNAASAGVFGTSKKRGGEVKSNGSLDVSKIAFGKAKWKKYFGDVGKEPDLPPNIKDILAADCRIFPGKKVCETHMLVLVPEKINGKPLTLESLNELQTKKKRPGAFLRNLTDECKKQSVASHWVLITKDVIGGEDTVNGTRNKRFEDQDQKLQQIVTDTGIPYTLPSVRDMAVALFMHHAATGKRLFALDYVDPEMTAVAHNTYTRCLDNGSLGNPVVVGDFLEAYLTIEDHADIASERYGIAASWLL